MRRVNLVEGPVGGHLVSLGMFLALSVVSVMATSMADTYFVAHVGAHELAALSFTFPILMITSALSLGFGNGVVAVVARAVGEGDHALIQAQSTDSLLLGLMVTVVLATTGYFTIDPLFKLLGANQDVLPLIRSYMKIWYLGCGLQIVPQIGQNIIRAHGDTRTPGLIAVTMAVTNVLIDPILILGWGPVPALGLEGAAIAAILSRTLSLAGVMFVLHFRMHALAPISLTTLRLRNSWGRLLHIGLPATATQLVMPVSAAIMTKIVALSGVLSVAAYGVASRIEMVTGIYLWAVAGAMPAFVGQNAGAGRMERVHEAVTLAIRFCIIAGLCMLVVALTTAHIIVARFTTDPEVQALATYYLRVVSPSYALSGLVMVASQTMNALRRPLPASMVNLARTAVLTVPLALLGNWLDQVHGVFIAISVSGAVCGALAWIIMTSIVRQETLRVASAAA